MFFVCFFFFCLRRVLLSFAIINNKKKKKEKEREAPLDPIIDAQMYSDLMNRKGGEESDFLLVGLLCFFFFCF